MGRFTEMRRGSRWWAERGLAVLPDLGEVVAAAEKPVTVTIPANTPTKILA
jgi:hypothetical protein